MSTRPHAGALTGPFRWLAQPMTWAALAAAVIWLRARTRPRVGVSPVSADWLQDNERKAIRSREL